MKCVASKRIFYKSKNDIFGAVTAGFVVLCINTIHGANNDEAICTHVDSANCQAPQTGGGGLDSSFRLVPKQNHDPRSLEYHGSLGSWRMIHVGAMSRSNFVLNVMLLNYAVASHLMHIDWWGSFHDAMRLMP